MRIPVLLSMIAAAGFLSSCGGGLNPQEVAEIRGDCPDEAVRAAILDSRWRGAGMTFWEFVDELNRYDEGEYESEEEYYQNYGHKAKIRILRRIARTFERNIGRTFSPCRSEVRVHTFLDTGRIWRKYRFLLDHRNGRTLACHPRVCDKSGDGRIVACGRYEDGLEAYGICVDRQGEVQ